jgi:hypothetical protein
LKENWGRIEGFIYPLVHEEVQHSEGAALRRRNCLLSTVKRKPALNIAALSPIIQQDCARQHASQPLGDKLDAGQRLLHHRIIEATESFLLLICRLFKA